MSRGKDGYGALSTEEGAETIVDNENGVLITMVLRQYFLSLKVVGKWSRGGFYRNFFDPMKKEMSSKGSLVLPPKAAKREELDDDADTSGSEDENNVIENDDGQTPDVPHSDRVQRLIKRMGIKWARRANLEVDDHGRKDQNVDWTSAISPALEGRMVEVKKE